MRIKYVENRLPPDTKSPNFHITVVGEEPIIPHARFPVEHHKVFATRVQPGMPLQDVVANLRYLVNQLETVYEKELKEVMRVGATVELLGKPL